MQLRSRSSSLKTSLLQFRIHFDEVCNVLVAASNSHWYDATTYRWDGPVQAWWISFSFRSNKSLFLLWKRSISLVVLAPAHLYTRQAQYQYHPPVQLHIACLAWGLEAVEEEEEEGVVCLSYWEEFLSARFLPRASWFCYSTLYYWILVLQECP